MIVGGAVVPVTLSSKNAHCDIAVVTEPFMCFGGQRWFDHRMYK